MLGMYKKTLSQARHRCFAAALSVVVMLAALMFQDAASAADNGSIGARDYSDRQGRYNCHARRACAF